MKTICVQHPINLKVVRFELDFSSFLEEKPPYEREKPKPKKIILPNFKVTKKKAVPTPPTIKNNKKRDIKELVEDLLNELYSGQRDWSNSSSFNCSQGSTSAASLASSQSCCEEDHPDSFCYGYLEFLDTDELRSLGSECENRLQVAGERLAKCVRIRDRLKRHQKRLCGALTVLLRHITGVSGARFGVTPGAGEGPGEGGYAEWLQAMRLVARLPAGVPHHFRRKLWLTLAERHLTARGIDWPSAERACFRGTAQPDDAELGAQIIKDLHRTGCSLFCGAEGRENQGMLRRVLLAYARWNKDVGYCQGFNMLAAIILEVMDKSESDSLKVMIYLVEAVLPEGYFADDLRGLSADMAAFRDLLRIRLPRLATHMDYLQRISDGGGVEPPLPDVFTMQWFLTLYATWLPRDSLLRIWDLILLDGNEVLLLTALAIWDLLQDRILSARSADEFYSCMGGGVGAVWEAGEALVVRVVAFGSVPELPRLRNLHRYRVSPPVPPAPPTTAPVCQPPLHTAMQTMTKRGLRLFYSEDEGDSSDDGNKMALTTVIPRREERSGAGDRLSLDIGALKRQYARLRERQRQAHVILAAACARHAAVGVPTSPTSLTVNNLLLGKSAIVSSRGRRLGPPPGAIPPSRLSRSHEKTESKVRVKSNDTISWKEEKTRKTLNRRNSLKWKDLKKDKAIPKGRKASIELDETGDGVIVSDKEANEMIATLRSRSSSETSSYSSRTNSSTDTSLCDENERGSDSDTDLLDEAILTGKKNHTKNDNIPVSPNLKDTKIYSPILKESIISSSTSPDQCRKTNVKHSNSVKEIADFLDSAAGEPLRTYIDEFETKLKDSKIVNESESYDPRAKLLSPLNQNLSKSFRIARDLECKALSPSLVSTLDSHKISLSTQSTKSPIHRLLTTRDDFSKLSPSYVDSRQHSSDSLIKPIELKTTSIESRVSPSAIISQADRKPQVTLAPSYTATTPSGINILHRLNLNNNSQGFNVPEDLKKKLVYMSPATLTPTNNLLHIKSFNKIHQTRPPDIIDSLTMYENFVPDIDLSEDNSPDTRSLIGRSPENDSIIVSEDEPPIPLKIDKYFEHSPEFFGARVTDPNNADIPNRRSTRRVSRLPKKPDSLTLQSSHNEKLIKDEYERASSLPQSHSFTKKLSSDDEFESKDVMDKTKIKTPENTNAIDSPKDYILRSGRKNSERALQIIQENSKILSRILTKQNMTEAASASNEERDKLFENEKPNYTFCSTITDKSADSKLIDSPLLKESNSDSLIGCKKRHISDDTSENREFVRVRPISIDDPFSVEVRDNLPIVNNFSKPMKSPSSDCLGNKTDTYGWENKGFLADRSPFLDKNDAIFGFDFKTHKTNNSIQNSNSKDTKLNESSEWSRHSFSGESRPSVTLPSSNELKDTSTFGRRFTSDCNYPLSSKYNDYMLSEASHICRKTTNEGSKDNLPKTDDSQASDFTHVVTSSISFTYEPSVDDDSPTGGKSNSSDTLCQITSLDQVSTPISPKMFPIKDIPPFAKDFIEKSDRMKLESDDTCSTITSLPETDTLSSLSYPRSPSTGSYHPFPSRPAIRMPKEIGVKLGMYPKDAINSAPK